MIKSLVLASALALLGACSSPVSPPGGTQDAPDASPPTDAAPSDTDAPPGLLDAGARLEAQDGGTWFDTDLNQGCSFARASDGVTRCIPQGPVSAIWFASDCTTPVGVWTVEYPLAFATVGGKFLQGHETPGAKGYVPVQGGCSESPLPKGFVYTFTAPADPSGFAAQ